MNVRRFELNISCPSCVNAISKVFRQYPEIKYKLNILEKMMIVEADEQKYDDNFIINLIKHAGYDAEVI